MLDRDRALFLGLQPFEPLKQLQTCQTECAQRRGEKNMLHVSRPPCCKLLPELKANAGGAQRRTAVQKNGPPSLKLLQALR
eukprot:4546182-Pyramimonas_sp.AAC.1